MSSISVSSTWFPVDESVKQLVGIVDFANYVGQWINVQQKLNPKQVFSIFLKNRHLTSNQIAIISTLCVFDELHIVVKDKYALDASSIHFKQWFNGRLFFHMPTSSISLTFNKQKEMDDVTCIYLREMYIRQGYDAIVVSNDQYRSFAKHTVENFAFKITSWELSDSFIDVTQNMQPCLFSEASPNLIRYDPKDCSFFKCPSFPNNSTKQDWIQIDKPQKGMLDVADSTIDQFSDNSSANHGHSFSESFDELMIPTFRQSLEETLDKSFDELMTNTLRQSQNESMNPISFDNMLDELEYSFRMLSLQS
jgi:hypothetical protein